MTPQYALVTPARNEEAYIRDTIESVLAQTIKPVRWVIISDGSSDRTDEIVASYQQDHDFIRLIRLPRESKRNFGSKVFAIREGIRLLSGIEYNYFGNLDADVSLPPHYFETLVSKFDANSQLGLAGGTIWEMQRGVFRPRLGNVTHSVPGAIQFFRRECYEQIGGYIPQRLGGIDSIAEGMARMHGWEVRSYFDLPVKHHRSTGAKAGSCLHMHYFAGARDYYMGDRPLFYLGKCLKRIRAKPLIIGFLVRLVGYYSVCFKGIKPSLPNDYLEFLKREQSQRLKAVFLGKGEK